MARRLGRMTGLGWMALALAGALFGALGCADEEPVDIRPYTDSAGRSCNVDVHDVSGTATCDADASALITCDTGQDAEFVINDDYDFDVMIWTLESCTGCVDREARQTFIGVCANIECVSDTDCVRDNYMCNGGICTHD